MHMPIYNRLLELARAGQLTTYGEIAPLAGLSMDDPADRAEMSRLLEEVARHEETARRPMLTAIVVHQGNDNNPGEGFFTLGTEFRRFNGSRRQMERLQFWVSQVGDVHGYWKTH